MRPQLVDLHDLDHLRQVNLYDTVFSQHLATANTGYVVDNLDRDLSNVWNH